MDDVLKQKAYSIYKDGEYYGMINGHDAEHAAHKMAQHEELDLRSLTAERTWPNSEQ